MVGRENLTHCWPHDKRWLVNKSKANANVSMLCPAPAAGAAAPSRYNARKFLFATCTAFGRADYGPDCCWPSRCGMQHDWLLHSAATRHSRARRTGYSYFICPVDL